MQLVKKNWFPVLFGLIAAVSVFDTLLIVRFRDSICVMEENPMGSWLLEVASGDIGVFVRVKLAGTLIVLTTLTFRRLRRSRKALPVTTSIAAYQTSLLTYLIFA